MTCQRQRTLNIVVRKDSERIDIRIFIYRPIHNNSILIELVCITEVKDELPLICVNSSDLAVAESDNMHLGSTADIVLDLVLQLPVHKNNFKKIRVHVPWWIKNNRIIGGHRKSVFYRRSFNRNTSYLYFLECVRTF